MKRTAGWIIMALPFVGLFCLLTSAVGAGNALVVYGAAVIFWVLVLTGINMVSPK